MRRSTLLTSLFFSIVLSSAAQQVHEMAKALTFHVAFDGKPDADFAKGDGRLYHAPSSALRDKSAPGLPVGGEVAMAPNAGRFSGALRFTQSKGPIVFYQAKDNLAMPTSGWSGTVSFWLSTDPVKDLADGYCDPIQITSKQWDDASMFVEFEKRPPGIPFRLGVYADKNVWNPQGRKFADIPAVERPLVTVAQPPFVGGKWTHAAFTFDHFNTGKADGVATLYLDGNNVGDLSARPQTFTWDAETAAIMVGLGYIGLMDDLAVFDRALTTKEIATLFALKNGIRDLTKKP